MYIFPTHATNFPTKVYSLKTSKLCLYISSSFISYILLLQSISTFISLLHFIPEGAKDVEEERNLWNLSDEERLNFIRALRRKIVLDPEFTEAVTSYEEVSNINLLLYGFSQFSILIG
jgi:uncharacterized protein (DUF1778 family)